MGRKPFGVLVLVVAACMSTAVMAQVPSGSVRMSADASILRFHIGGWNPSGEDDWRVKRLEAGFGNPNAALGLGLTVADALTIGLRFVIAIEQQELSFDEEDSGREEPPDFDPQKYSVLRWGVLPYLEYAFLQKVVRPFIMVMLGFEGDRMTNSAATINFWDFVFGAGGGLHFFASPSVSIDLGITLGFSAGGGKETPDVDEDTLPEGEEVPVERYTRILFRLSGILGVSGWF